MQPTLTLSEEIHHKAVEISIRYRRAEGELIEVLQKVELHRVFLKKGHSSLFSYVIRELGISESVAYNLISVSRKAQEIPALRTEIEKGRITLSNARKIIPVLNQENQSEWLRKAGTLSYRELEKEIVKVRPEEATPERATYVTENRFRVEFGLQEVDLRRLRRVQDLLSQAKKRPVTLEGAVIEMTRNFLERHDPIERANRARARFAGAPKQSKVVKSPVALQVRSPLPASVLHQVNLRDQGCCTFTNSDGKRCDQTRWLEIHHRIPVSHGGANSLENLVTLCFAHHSWLHSEVPTSLSKVETPHP